MIKGVLHRIGDDLETMRTVDWQLFERWLSYWL